MPTLNCLVDAPLSTNTTCEKARAAIEELVNRRTFQRFEALKQALPPKVQAHLALCRAKNDCYSLATSMLEARQLSSVKPIR